MKKVKDMKQMKKGTPQLSRLGKWRERGREGMVKEKNYEGRRKG